MIITTPSSGLLREKDALVRERTSACEHTGTGYYCKTFCLYKCHSIPPLYILESAFLCRVGNTSMFFVACPFLRWLQLEVMVSIALIKHSISLHHFSSDVAFLSFVAQGVL